MALKQFCDRCDREINVGDTFAKWKWTKFKYLSPMKEELTGEDNFFFTLLCKPCTETLELWMKNNVQTRSITLNLEEEAKG